MNEEINMEIVEKYQNIASFQNKEQYLLYEANANLETLEYILNDETDEEMADFVEMVITITKEE